MSSPDKTPAPVTEMKVNLIPKAVEALDFAATLTLNSRTDTVNLALQLYAVVMRELAQGKRWFLLGLDGTYEEVHIDG